MTEEILKFIMDHEDYEENQRENFPSLELMESFNDHTDLRHENILEDIFDIIVKEDKPKCGQCGKEVKQMKKHMLTHSGEKPHECDICNRRFSQKSNLNRHRTSLHKGFLIQCTVCKAFKTTRRDKLKIHLKSAHKLLEAKLAIISF